MNLASWNANVARCTLDNEAKLEEVIIFHDRPSADLARRADRVGEALGSEVVRFGVTSLLAFALDRRIVVYRRIRVEWQ
jgi:hypothetical protein